MALADEVAEVAEMLTERAVAAVDSGSEVAMLRAQLLGTDLNTEELQEAIQEVIGIEDPELVAYFVGGFLNGFHVAKHRAEEGKLW